MTTDSILWHSSKRDQFGPFEVLDAALANVEFRASTNKSFSKSESIFIEEPLSAPSLQLKLSFDVNDIERLSAEVEKPALHILVRDRNIGLFEDVLKLNLSSIGPDEVVPVTLRRVPIPEAPFIDVVVALVSDESDSLPVIRGRKTFKIRSTGSRQTVPRRIVEPNEFEEQGLDVRTPWYVHWRGVDANKSLGDLVEVWLNADFEDQFQLLSDPIGLARHEPFVNSMEGQILFEVVYGVLALAGEGISDYEETSAAAAVSSFAADILRIDLAPLISQMSAPEQISKLRARCYQYCELSKAMEALES